MSLNEALYLLLIIFELILLSWMSFYILSLIFSWMKGAPYVATRRDELGSILQQLRLKKSQRFLELGCGDGRVTRRVVEEYKVHGTGVDINPLLIWKAQFLSYFKGLKNTYFRVENVIDSDVAQADVIYIYLFPKLVQQLKTKLLQQTKSDVIIVGHGFKIDYLERYRVMKITGKKFKTYVYRLEGSHNS